MRRTGVFYSRLYGLALTWTKQKGQPWWHARKDEALNFSPIQPPVSSENTIHESVENDNARTSESDYEDVDMLADVEDSKSVVRETDSISRTRRIPGALRGIASKVKVSEQPF